MGVMLCGCGWQTRESPARVTTAQAKAAATQVANSDDPNQIVCVREEVTGSRLVAARECHTRAEWAERREHGEQQMQVISDGPNAAAMRANGQ